MWAGLLGRRVFREWGEGMRELATSTTRRPLGWWLSKSHRAFKRRQALHVCVMRE